MNQKRWKACLTWHAGRPAFDSAPGIELGPSYLTGSGITTRRQRQIGIYSMTPDRFCYKTVVLKTPSQFSTTPVLAGRRLSEYPAYLVDWMRFSPGSHFEGSPITVRGPCASIADLRWRWLHCIPSVAHTVYFLKYTVSHVFVRRFYRFPNINCMGVLSYEISDV
jgi:hypothetical protein